MYSFIKIPYSFLEGKNKMSPEELFLYIRLLQRKTAFNDITYTSIDLISQEINFQTRERRNKNKIKEIILSLKDKKYISLTNESFNYFTLLKISFPTWETRKEFVIIEFEEYESFINPTELFIYTFIKKWNKLGCRKSFEEWSEILGKSTKTVKNILYNMKKKNIINIKSGVYYLSDGHLKQQKNEYHIISPRQKNTKKAIEQEKEKNKKSVKIVQEDDVEEIIVNVKRNDNVGSAIEGEDKLPWE